MRWSVACQVLVAFATVTLVLPVAGQPEAAKDSASWDVLGGGAMGAQDEAPVDWMWNPPATGFLRHGPDLVGFGRDAVLGCRVIILSAPSWTGETIPLDGCDRPEAIGTSAIVGDIVIGCVAGTTLETPFAFGYDLAKRATAWTLGAQDIGGRAGTWGCGQGAVVGEHDLVLPVWGRSAPAQAFGIPGEEAFARFVRVDATTGGVRWSRPVSATTIIAESTGFTGTADASEAPSLQPLAVVAAGEGFVATADLGEERVLLQLSADGRFRGALRQSASPYGRPGVSVAQATLDVRDTQAAADEAWGMAPASIRPATDGSVAYVAWGTTFLAVDAFTSRPVATVELGADLGGAHPYLGPVVTPTGIAVPMTYGVALVDPSSMSVRWERTFPQVFNGGVWDVQSAPDGSLMALADDTRLRIQVHVLDSATGTTLQQLHVPIGLSQRLYLDKLHLAMLPAGNGTLVWERTGAVSVLGSRDQHPPLSSSTRYPAPLTTVTLLSIPPGPDLAAQVAWGDSTVTPLPPGATSATHVYQDAGTRIAHWTWVDPETGVTWSSGTRFDVGGSPPPHLNFLQRAFSDQNRDTTWGIIGLVLAAFSGAGAFAAATWRRRGLAADLRRLDAIRTLGATDPVGAASELRDYRRGLRERAAKGQVQGGEFASLSHEAVALSQTLQRRVLAPYQDRIDDHLRALLDAAMADGVLTAGESERIGSAIKGELALTPGERTDLARLLGVWA